MEFAKAEGIDSLTRCERVCKVQIQIRHWNKTRTALPIKIYIPHSSEPEGEEASVNFVNSEDMPTFLRLKTDSELGELKNQEILKFQTKLFIQQRIHFFTIYIQLFSI